MVGTLKGTLGPEDKVGWEVVDEPWGGRAVGWAAVPSDDHPAVHLQNRT